MDHTRTKKYFGDIIPAARINAPRTKIKTPDAIENDAALLEVIWDAMNGRGKRAAEPVEPCETAGAYYEDVEAEYIDIDAAIIEALKEVNLWDQQKTNGTT